MDNRKNAVLYGAGKMCRLYAEHIARDFRILAVIDKNPDMWGKSIYNIPIISLDEYIEKYSDTEIIFTLNHENIRQAETVLKEKNITKFSSHFKVMNPYLRVERENVTSYSDPNQLEDIILYNALYDFSDFFYIDVGSCDPFFDSVTKLLYDSRHAHGINIEPQQEYVDITNVERPRDINICCALSNVEGNTDFFVQSGRSTLLPENANNKYLECKRKVNTTTLKNICDKYVPEGQEIVLLKIDVEGSERDVLEGADFKKYRPFVIVMEATLPDTDIPCFDKWEDLLIAAHYHYVYSYGVNRYYVADEHSELDKNFIPMIDILRRFCIYRTR